MSSVLHPVGPEEPQTYWVRRALVVGAVLLVLALIITLVANTVGSGSAVSANPASGPTAVVDPATPSASPESSPTSEASAANATPTSPVPTGTTASNAATPTPVEKGTMSAKPSASPTKTKPAAPVACDPDEVRVTLTGRQRLKPKKANTFELSVINGSASTCRARVTRNNFELKIYSGTDRIWSTNDCPRAVKTVAKTLKSQQAVAWSMRWNGRRSRDECRNRPEIPRPGTYFATAQLDGAKPVQLRMILRG